MVAEPITQSQICEIKFLVKQTIQNLTDFTIVWLTGSQCQLKQMVSSVTLERDLQTVDKSVFYYQWMIADGYCKWNSKKPKLW
jgi:hypothetical protein